MIVQAKFIAPVGSPVIENGAIEFANGRIIAVGQASRFVSRGAMAYGDAVILPGFVNAHTHLELSLLAGRVPPSPNFTDWLKRLIAARNLGLNRATPSPYQGAGSGSQPPSDPCDYFARAVEAGIAQSLAGGVTTIADITANPQFTRPVLARSPLCAVSFGEVIAMGKGRNLLSARLAAAADTALQSEHLRIGISPHAPYTVEPVALRACAEKARAENLPLSIHVSETSDEDLFVRSGEGPFADFLAGLGFYDDMIPKNACNPVELLQSTGSLGPRTILAHANHVSDNDIALIAGSGASIAYCPRTHAAFGHPPHRFRDMLRAGVNVCIGTDSLASNPSLSMLDELRFLGSMCHDVSPEVLLGLTTLSGARALNLAHNIGSLQEGKSADFSVIPLPAAARSWTAMLESESPPAAVYIEGNLIHTVKPLNS